jgi:hypothetical protein
MANTHMKMFVVVLVLALGPGHSFACSPMANSPAIFEPETATQNSVAPGIPEISIEHISRGGDRPDSCSDIGRIVLSIASAQEAYAYRFTVIEGKSPSDGFDDKAVVGYVSNGMQTFQFSWYEPGKAGPLDFKVRVTAYSKRLFKNGWRRRVRHPPNL